MEPTVNKSRNIRMLALGVTALLFSVTVLAAPPAGPHHRGPDPQRMLAHMTAELDLTAEQREAVGEALEARRAETRSVHEQMRATHRELQGLDPAAPDYSERADALAERMGDLTTRMASLRSETHAEIIGVLNDEQQARLAEMREQRAQMMRDRREKMHQFHRKPNNDIEREPGASGGPDNDSGATEDAIL